MTYIANGPNKVQFAPSGAEIYEENREPNHSDYAPGHISRNSGRIDTNDRLIEQQLKATNEARERLAEIYASE
jgi:hypothetical protein